MTAVFDTAEALNIRRTESLTSLVRRELERMIECGELQGGDRLNENLLGNEARCQSRPRAGGLPRARAKRTGRRDCQSRRVRPHAE